MSKNPIDREQPPLDKSLSDQELEALIRERDEMDNKLKQILDQMVKFQDSREAVEVKLAEAVEKKRLSRFQSGDQRNLEQSQPAASSTMVDQREETAHRDSRPRMREEGVRASNARDPRSLSRHRSLSCPRVIHVTPVSQRNIEEMRTLDQTFEETRRQPDQKRSIYEVPIAAESNINRGPQDPRRFQEFRPYQEQYYEGWRKPQRQEAPRFLQELPEFSGQYEDWLQFNASFRDTRHYFTDIENAARLRKCLKGAAREAVQCLLVCSATPDEVLQALERRFGRSEYIAASEIAKLKNLPKLTENPNDLCVFAGRLANITATISTLKCTEYLYNPELVTVTIEKLTPVLRHARINYDRLTNQRLPKLVRLAQFLNAEADLVGAYARPSVGEKSTKEKGGKSCYAAKGENQEKKKEECPKCNKSNHQLVKCRDFLKEDVEERWKLAKELKLCFRCLRSGHQGRDCKRFPCGENECTRSHHRLLHSKTKEDSEKVASSYSRSEEVKKAYLKIVPVIVKGPKKHKKTYALLDDGSTITLLDGQLAQELGIKGPKRPLNIEPISGEMLLETHSEEVTFNVAGVHDREKNFKIENARTVVRLAISPQNIEADVLRSCPHLEDIKEDQLVYRKAKPGLLIGQDNWHLLKTLEQKTGGSDQPVASLTPLGWVLHGYEKRRTLSNQTFKVGKVQSREDIENQDNIDQLLKDFFKLDSIGIEQKKPKSDPEEKALKILEETTQRRSDGRFETGLLWKKKEVNFPPSYPNALKRLQLLEKKLDRNQELKLAYHEKMRHNINMGYAEKITRAPTPNKTWYLPHFAVVTEAKPKPRIVLDAAAKSGGVSLNDELFSGPDLLQSLPGILMRFRQHSIAVAADIKEMFLQIRIREEDRDAQRFLWRENRNKPPDEYRMTSVIFGATSSPCTAMFVKNKNAEMNKEKYPSALEAIVHQHYMDDYLQSFRTPEEANTVVKEVVATHYEAKMEIRNWLSNHPEALADLAPESLKEGAQHLETPGASEKILGLIWQPKEDSFRFNLETEKMAESKLKDQPRPTKRQVLRIVMSIFDPLGLATPVTIQAKRIVQDIWRESTNWDEKITLETEKKWQKWLEELNLLRGLEIPRCYLKTEDIGEIELHTFTDASETSYVAAVYWRMKYPNGHIDISLAAAKGKVAPLKPTSVPRLELQAALIGARLAATVATEHEYQVSSRTFWSDSRTVLSWIRSDHRTFKTFVAHRLAEIEDISKINEWRWLPSSENVADEATRKVPGNFDIEHRWFQGPEFLKKEKSEWPQEQQKIEETMEEKKTVSVANIKYEDRLINVRRFSKWLRLVRSTARIFQFIEEATKKPQVVTATRKRTKKNEESDPDWRQKKATTKKSEEMVFKQREDRKFKPLSVEHMKKAETFLIQQSQRATFAKEIEALKKNKYIDKNSRLNALPIYVDQEGTLRLKTRTERLECFNSEITAPVILDGDDYFSKLYANEVHTKLHHGGIETVVNEIRQRFHMIKIRPTVRRVLKDCMPCRLRRAQPKQPPIGDLPSSRLAHSHRPFTYTGLDYFGPLTITVGRKNEKRYVALFTCLTSRAVHLELAASLTTDSAINALRRFIARRGCPAEIWSDCGKNFVGADTELRRAALEALEDESVNRMIKWKFLPPAAPFMAGVWERLVKTVKDALKRTLDEIRPHEETLTTLLAEIEHTVNSRPLTYVTTEADEPEALTPNHLLLGSSSRVPVPGAFVAGEEHAKSLWRRAQRLADVFWQRWLKEYLPTLHYRREIPKPHDNIKEGDLVMIIDGSFPRNTWPRGIVTKTFPGNDGVVRVIEVKTKNGTYKRPTKKVVVLPIHTASSTAGEM